MRAFESALADAGGADAPATATARLSTLLADALAHGRRELAQKRSGYDEPVTVAFAATPEGLAAALPVDAAFRADADAVSDREWAVVASAVAALAEAVEAPPPSRPQDLRLTAGHLAGALLLRVPGVADAELAVLAFDEHVQAADRLRARALHVPPALLADVPTRAPIGAGHPLKVAEAVARLGGDPAAPDAADQFEDLLAAVLQATDQGARPHEDPVPASRVARRILQRLAGMGKWGGFHTEFTHLPRGFAGNDRALAIEVGEALLAAGLLQEKPSVGQRHVYLNPRRAGDIHKLIDEGIRPADLRLPGG